jgi:cobalt-zinc-cadmium efflux system protein
MNHPAPGHPHSHGLSRSADLSGVSDARLLGAVILNQALTVGQVIAGVISGSVALFSDAAHNFNDANALLIAYAARRISGKRANRRYTFGYRRAETVGALINLTLLGVIGLYLVYEGMMRAISPQEVIGWLMGIAAAVALVIDLATAWLLWAMSGGSLNVRAAFVHNLVDALGSLAVLVGAGAVIWLDWYWIDPLLTLLIAAYILVQVARMLPQAARILMEGSPTGLDIDELAARLERLDGVENVHHVHVWELDEHHRALEAHLVTRIESVRDLETLRADVKSTLRDDFAINHSTLEFELAGSRHACDETEVIKPH